MTKISGKGSSLATALSNARSRLEGLMDEASVPTNLKPIAKQLGVMGLRRSDLGVAAMLVPHASGYFAVVNRNNSLGLQRFALAHEIGHLLLNAADDRLGVRHRASSLKGSHDEVEDACNLLAAEMLMPRAALINHAEAQGWNFGAVERISSDFFVDIEHAAERMMEFSPQQSAMVTPPWSLPSDPLPARA